MPLLVVHDLHVDFITRDGTVRALNGVSVSVDSGQVLALLGESGSGKSVTLRSILGLHPRGNTRVTGLVLLKGHDVNAMSDGERRAYRGRVVSMVFQEPLTALDPVFRIGEQIVETLVRHRAMTRAEALRRARELLDIVQVPSPERVLGSYPHEISGGMRQRAMIAIALACEPELLLADEPTTALDVTVQAQILWLLRDIQRRLGLAVIFVTHDLGVAAEVADDAAVMYAGRVVESGPVKQLFRSPVHPYTQALLSSIPRMSDQRQRLTAIEGQPPDLSVLPPGCAFGPRCSSVVDRCREAAPPELAAAGRTVRCWLAPAAMSALAPAADSEVA